MKQEQKRLYLKQVNYTQQSNNSLNHLQSVKHSLNVPYTGIFVASHNIPL